jgi:hypothetical protein
MVKTAVDATYDLYDMLHPVAPGMDRDCRNMMNQYKIQVETVNYVDVPVGKN